MTIPSLCKLLKEAQKYPLSVRIAFQLYEDGWTYETAVKKLNSRQFRWLPDPIKWQILNDLHYLHAGFIEITPELEKAARRC